MRVEVEVYKGPLSKEMPIQRGELIGMIRDASRALYELKYDTQVTMCRLGCKFSRTSEPRELGNLAKQDKFCEASTVGYKIDEDMKLDEKAYRTCPILVNILDDTKELYADVCEFSNLDPIGFKCDDEEKRKKELIDKLAQGMIDETLANEEFTKAIKRIVGQNIAKQAERKRTSTRGRVAEKIREEIDIQLQPERAKYFEQYRLEQRRSFDEITRIRDDIEGKISDVEKKYNELISGAQTQIQLKSKLNVERDKAIGDLEKERKNKLQNAQTENEQRLSDIEHAYDNLEEEIEARLRERQGEISDKVEGELEKERQKLRDDPEIRQNFATEARDSLRGEAKEDAKSRLISANAGELAQWIEPRENAVKFNVYRRAGKVAQRLRSRAEYWATVHTAVAPKSKRVRIEMADFANFTASYGNQIGARADALLKQTEWNRNPSARQGTALARELLASSTFLRDSQPTSYLKLYEWNKAAVVSGSDAVDRVRMVEQLVKDTYWANVNTVFATGQGTFTTALIKDDIGNWNLKNYDNAPGELVDAYKKAGFAAVKAVADVAQAAVSGGGTVAAEKALSTANKVALGVGPEQADAVKARLESLTATSQQRISAIGDRQQELLKNAIQAVEAAKQTEGSAKMALDSAAAEVAVATENLEKHVLTLGAKEDALKAVENELISVSANRKAKGVEYETVSDEISELEESGNNETVLAEKKKQRDDAANELVKLQNREIGQLKVVRDEREAMNNFTAAMVAAKDIHKKRIDEHLDKRAANAKATAATKMAEGQMDAIPQNAMIQIQQVLDFHRDMIDAIEKEQADKEK